MENNYIKLNKVREFGDVFNDTFAFLKQEAKPLGSALLVFALPLLLISAIATAYIQSQQFNNILGSPNFDYGSYFSKIAFLMIFIILSQTMLMVTVNCYLKLYRERGAGNFDNTDIFNEIKKNFFTSLGATILLGIIIFIGLMMCVIPGIYLGVSLSFVIPVMILENKGFADGFSRSFDLAHKQWWWTFLILFVYIILVYVFTIILSIPGIIFGITSMFKLKELSTIEYPTYLIIYNAVLSLLTTLFYVFLHTAIAFQYFNIVELYEGKTLSEKIDLIKKDDQL